jgi:NADH-quinone oxidoreductase subunit M
MNFLKIAELIFMSNFALIFLPLRKLTKKTGTLLFVVVLTGCLLLTLRLGAENLWSIDFLNRNLSGSIFIIDYLGAFLGVLTFFLTFVCVSFLTRRTFNGAFYLLVFLVLELFLFHTFASVNMLVFYVMFETTLIPMFLLILLWGSRQRKLHAMYMFFFYTVVGSILLFSGILFTFLMSGSFLMSFVTHLELELSFFAAGVWIFFFLGFAFKVPVAPFHTWLPEAHVEAPTVGSIILAGLLLKIGTFGMLRFMFPWLNGFSYEYQPIVFVLGIFSIFYASLIAIRQIDMKKIIAYSSVAHMAFVVMGLFSLTYFGFVGSYYTMLSHGIVASALFFLVGVLYDRYKTRNLLYLGGLVLVMPIFAFVFFIFSLANIGFPFTSNFIGELFIILGVISKNLFAGLWSLFSVVLPPLYTMWMYNRIFYGNLSKNIVGFSDLNVLEFYVSFIMLALTLLLGVNPHALTFYVELSFVKLMV